jgi:hypothetical protein
LRKGLHVGNAFGNIPKEQALVNKCEIEKKGKSRRDAL